MIKNYDRVKYAVDEIKIRAGDICRQFPNCKDCPFHDTYYNIIDSIVINTFDDCMVGKFCNNWDRFNEKKVDK